MKRQVGLVQKLLLGALLSSTAWAVPGLQAQAAEFPVKAAAADPVPFWWFHGTVEVGGRVFLNHPKQDGRADLAQASLAKYYEYSRIAPGPFGNIELATGSRDGLYQFNFAGTNIGYKDQSYYLDYSQAGKQYLSLGWDETPHLYSKSASTPFYVNGNQLTLTCGLGLVGPNNIPCNYTTDIGIQRDTASVKYRWTPTDAWDVTADFSHMRRTGTQIAGIVSGSASPVQVPRPVADTTQNYGLNGEYSGTSLWGQKIVANVGYAGSQYTDDYAAYTVQNPNNVLSTTNSLINQISTPPSNQANAFNGTIAADLPWKSRYVGTINYNMMRQDAAFNSMTVQGPVTLPASSLNGKIDTLLLNNVVTTKITPQLTNKLSYRYYDFNNGTPELLFTNWIRNDNNPSTQAGRPNIRSLSINYNRQNAGDELVWRPSREWTVGTAYGYERYNYSRVDADVTNEHSAKVFADWKPVTWLTARSSGSYANRRYENYDYLNNVGMYQSPIDTGAARYQSSYRQLMISNRQQWKANFALDVVVLPMLTLTPTFKYQDENYSVNPLNQQGLEDRRLWSAGIDATYAFSRDTSLTVGYMRDYVTQLLIGTSCTNTSSGGGGCNPTPIPGFPATAYQMETNDKATYDTFTALVRHAAIPNKLDTELRYVASHGIDRLRLNANTTVAPVPSGGQFPDMTTWYQRLDAVAIYKFDPALIAQLGWKGQVKAKLRYTWERNSVSWWATDIIGLNQGGGNNILMAADNPNYNVHMIGTSLAYTW